MRSMSIPAVLFSIALVCGCAQKHAMPSSSGLASQQAGGLVMSLEVPGTSYAVGGQMPVTIIARNTAKEPVRITANSTDLAQVRIYQHTPAGWDLIKQYPQAAISVMSPWTLGPQQERVWHMSIPVEPDWPTGEPLRVAALLNGRTDVSPSVIVNVSTAKKAQ
jgi:hypothetical protein